MKPESSYFFLNKQHQSCSAQETSWEDAKLLVIANRPPALVASNCGLEKSCESHLFVFQSYCICAMYFNVFVAHLRASIQTGWFTFLLIWPGAHLVATTHPSWCLQLLLLLLSITTIHHYYPPLLSTTTIHYYCTPTTATTTAHLLTVRHTSIASASYE